jgi:hypothetical protein
MEAGNLQPNFMSPHARQVQQVIYQKTHAARAFADALQMMLALGRDLRTEFLQQNLGKSANMPQRGPQVVGDRISERFQFPVRGFQLSRALFYSLFQFIVELANFPLRFLPLGNIAGRGKHALDFSRLVFEHGRVVQHVDNLP